MLPHPAYTQIQIQIQNYYEYLPCSYTHSDADRRAKADGKFAPDDVGRDELCCFWFAGTDVPEGGELCNRYGYMAPDQVMREGWGGKVERMGQREAWKGAALGEPDRRAPRNCSPPPQQTPQHNTTTSTHHHHHHHHRNTATHRHHNTPPQKAFFQYGFVLRTGGPPDLSRADAAFFTAEHIYGSLAHVEPAPFDGARGSLGGSLACLLLLCCCFAAAVAAALLLLLCCCCCW